MAFHEQTCYTCWGTFTTPHAYITTCPTCRQTKTLIEHRDRQAQQQRDDAERQMEMAAREQRMREYHTNQLIRAENERIEAINHQTRILEETRLVSAKDAYQEGLNYIKNNWYQGRNYAKLSLYAKYDGNLYASWKWDDVYVSEILRREFTRGIADSLATLNGDSTKVRETIVDSAYRAGEQNAKGTLKNKFCLHTGVVVNNQAINTPAVDSKLKSTIDTCTGKITFDWTPPFPTPFENDQFARGVQKAQADMNTFELMKQRLKEEVPKIIKEQKRVAGIRFLNWFLPTISAVSLVVMALLAAILFDGWAMFIALGGVMALGSVIRTVLEDWRYKHYEDL